MSTYTAYNAVTGAAILAEVSEAQFDRWYDHHSDYRKVRDIGEVNPACRDLYAATWAEPGVHWLVQD